MTGFGAPTKLLLTRGIMKGSREKQKSVQTDELSQLPCRAAFFGVETCRSLVNLDDSFDLVNFLVQMH